MSSAYRPPDEGTGRSGVIPEHSRTRLHRSSDYWWKTWPRFLSGFLGALEAGRIVPLVCHAGCSDRFLADGRYRGYALLVYRTGVGLAEIVA
jgi:hypothetical protein